MSATTVPARVDLSLRSVVTASEYEQCVELQRLTWGSDYRELVPPTILKISQKVGGVVAGAFTPDDRMLGFVFGISGVRNARRAHWSHMLAVRPEARGLGLGKDLKILQRALLLEIGIEVVYWTFDPLIARNANLNLNRLGARPEEYVRDMYGRATGSEVHDTLGTDRFIVAWEIGSPRVGRRLGVEVDRNGSTAVGDFEPIPLPREAADLGSSDFLTGEPRLNSLAPRARAPYWVEVPVSVEELQGRDLTRARQWRATTRDSIEAAFQLGHRVAGLAIGVLENNEFRRPAGPDRADGHDRRRFFYYFEPGDAPAGRGGSR